MLLSGLILSLATGAFAALNVTLCSDSQCKDPPLASYRLDERNVSQCLTNYAGQALALLVDTWHDQMEEASSPANIAIARTEDDAIKDVQLAVRFYRSTDCFGHCGSGHLIMQMEGRGWGMLSLGKPIQTPTQGSVLQSFEIVRLDENGHYAPHGYCGIRHGDAAFFRGRHWKWQQIGAQAFREVPMEEWDDKRFPLHTGVDYDMHGSVDEMGKTKMQQVAKWAWHGVPLEDWDDETNVRGEEELGEYTEEIADEDTSEDTSKEALQSPPDL